MKSFDLGLHAEVWLSSVLTKHYQMTLLKHRFRAVGSEIDLIFQKSNKIFFIEVKFRKNFIFNSEELVPRFKKKCLIRGASQYVAMHNLNDKILRFDLAIISLRCSNFFVYQYVHDFLEVYDFS